MIVTSPEYMSASASPQTWSVAGKGATALSAISDTSDTTYIWASWYAGVGQQHYIPAAWAGDVGTLVQWQVYVRLASTAFGGDTNYLYIVLLDADLVLLAGFALVLADTLTQNWPTLTQTGLSVPASRLVGARVMLWGQQGALQTPLDRVTVYRLRTAYGYELAPTEIDPGHARVQIRGRAQPSMVLRGTGVRQPAEVRVRAGAPAILEGGAVFALEPQTVLVTSRPPVIRSNPEALIHERAPVALQSKAVKA